ncbi:MAG: methyltransferase domain-containing protein [Bacteroidetes bacterium]|nr:methyltransferase domain-containing protein [Bacteroidota bacterium]
METGSKRWIRTAGYALRKLKLRIKGLYYSGNTFFCPLCNRFYRKFLDGGEHHEVLIKMQVIGAGRRPNMVCPGCHSTDRDRLLHTFFCHGSDIPFPDARMLHIAPEPALYDWFMRRYREKPHNYIAGVKYHEGYYYNQSIQLLDLTALPFPDESFDLLMANHVLEHIKAEQKALSEIHRVLRPGGMAILQVPWSPLLETTIEEESEMSETDRARHFGQADHVRLYGKDYPKRLEMAGFLVERIDIQHINMDQNYLESIAINKNEIIFLANKQTIHQV